jgi:hypothetical protein
MSDITYDSEDRELCETRLRTIRPDFRFREDEPDPLIDMVMIAALNGVVENTPQQWRQRTAHNQMRYPFPQVDDDRYEDKPQWFLSSIVKWMKRSRRWPPGSVGRPETRGPREEAVAA